MKKIKDILSGLKSFRLHGSADIVISSLTQNTNEVKKECLFFAVKGTKTDGHNFIEEVIQKGATAIVCEVLPSETKEGVSYIIVEDSRQSMGYIASAYYDNPSEKLTLVGVTGTNGKSSIVSMLYQFFSNRGSKCGLISTIAYTIGNKTYESTHTTPDPIRLNQLFAEMVAQNCEYAFMEVSSIAIHQGRINGLHFDGAIFTNITHDHLDYHGNFAEYLRCKKLWFDNLPEDAFALVNLDDKNGKIMLQNCKAGKFYYALDHIADFKVKILETDFEGMLLKIGEDEVWVNLVGDFNASNLTAVYGAAFLLGIPQTEILTGLSALNGAKGRFERIRSANKITGIIDYAHTPDALKNVLETINKIRTGNEKLITVFGCGGNRDKAKRPIMGEIAGRLSTRVILTSDNPREENPQTIMEEVAAGIAPSDFKKILKISERAEAIRAAVAIAAPGDVILVAGKGHETYQEINGTKTHFDDREVLENSFKTLMN
ncbi:MAG: UDP-N-acetylmuramoyl-L-alanyl-D-glutamate--2,6-diaminopimelate ligase [Bacteroidetes bacterium]|nr:UDP-N-acetylmuramoyl-L-alanyl-D-glutamate--2,6-diaminopimelate ligase [Bacteroidota bacterium]